MPGVIKDAASAPDGPGRRPLIDPLDQTADDPSSWPPVEPFITTTSVTVPTPGGPVQQVERYWTRRGLEQWLAACPKDVVFLPLDPLNEGDDPARARPVVVRYDGIPIAIPKGRPVAVPAPIAAIIKQGQRPFRTAQAEGLDLYTITVGADEAPMGRYLGTTDDVLRG